MWLGKNFWCRTKARHSLLAQGASKRGGRCHLHHLFASYYFFIASPFGKSLFFPTKKASQNG